MRITTCTSWPCPGSRRHWLAFNALHTFALHALALGVATLTASAQGEPKTMKLEGAPSQTGTGALRCVPDETAQLGVRALDENLNRVLVQDYAPQARSTNENIVVARVTSNAASTVNVLCVGDGEAWITVEAAGLRADLPVLVGKARSRPSPKGGHPELAAAGVPRPDLPTTLRPAEPITPTRTAADQTVPTAPSGSVTLPASAPPTVLGTPAGSVIPVTPTPTPPADAPRAVGTSQSANTAAPAQQERLRTEWNSNSVTGFRGQNGRRLTMVCPPAPPVVNWSLYGSDPYTDDTYVCGAAVHAGLITQANGGVVTAIIGPDQGSYQSSMRYGVMSANRGPWWGSFSFDRSNGAGQLDWDTRATGLDLAGKTLPLVCPAGGALKAIYGTNIYSDDSSICTAAVHAGVITAAVGGTVTVQHVAGRSAYTSSTRNGVSSNAYGSSPASFRFPTEVAALAGPIGPPAARGIGGKAGLPVEQPITSLSAPTVTAAQAISRGRVIIHWNAVPGASRYHILYRPAGATQWAGLNDRPDEPPLTGTSYQSDPNRVVLPNGVVEFKMYAERETDPRNGLESGTFRLTVARHYGRYRVVVNGFKVNRASPDRSEDGKGDEVYVLVDYREANADGSSAGPSGRAESKTHGDINHPNWQRAGTALYRVQAGSLSNLGGLRTGDGYPNSADPWRDVGGSSTYSFPLFVWEGVLMEGGKKVVISPKIYEDDRLPSDSRSVAGIQEIIGFAIEAGQHRYQEKLLQLTFTEAEKIVSMSQSDRPPGTVEFYHASPATRPQNSMSAIWQLPYGAQYTLYLQVKRIE